MTHSDAAYQKAQRRYDSQEHPDYFQDREEEYEREAEIIETMLDICKGPHMAMADRKRGEDGKRNRVP
jgi:hypothetical protein